MAFSLHLFDFDFAFKGKACILTVSYQVLAGSQDQTAEG